MIMDHYRPLTLRVVTLTSDGGGGFTESYTDSQIHGYIGELSGNEILNNKQLGNNATAVLFTDSSLVVENRILDGTTEYNIVWKYKQVPRYALEQVK